MDIWGYTVGQCTRALITANPLDSNEPFTLQTLHWHFGLTLITVMVVAAMLLKLHYGQWTKEWLLQAAHSILVGMWPTNLIWFCS